MADTKGYEFNVAMTCEGCSSAVKRILDRYTGKGIPKFDINLDAKTVTVWTTMTQEEVQGIIEKCGKDVSYIGPKVE